MHHPVRRRFHLWCKAPGYSLMLAVYQNTGLGRIALEEREKGRKQSKLVQVGGPQIEREPAYPAKKVVDDGPRLVKAGPDVLGR